METGQISMIERPTMKQYTMCANQSFTEHLHISPRLNAAHIFLTHTSFRYSISRTSLSASQHFFLCLTKHIHHLPGYRMNPQCAGIRSTPLSQTPAKSPAGACTGASYSTVPTVRPRWIADSMAAESDKSGCGLGGPILFDPRLSPALA
jgi:hypothetical protein